MQALTGNPVGEEALAGVKHEGELQAGNGEGGDIQTVWGGAGCVDRLDIGT
mgnify:CR=1 FL=1